MSTFKHRGVEQLVARQAHNLEVARSNPASATIDWTEALNKGVSSSFRSGKGETGTLVTEYEPRWLPGKQRKKNVFS